MASRRSVLAGALVPLTGQVAGCSTIRSALAEPERDLELVDYFTDPKFDGVFVYAYLFNDATEPRDGTLVVRIDVVGGDTYTHRRSFTVDVGGQKRYRHTIDVPTPDRPSDLEYSDDAWLE